MRRPHRHSGVQPDVALATVRLGMGTGSVAAPVDLEEGVAYLDREHPRASRRLDEPRSALACLGRG